MRILKHYYVDETLQRSVAEHNGIEVVRIAQWVDSAGELDLKNNGEVWLERQKTGVLLAVSQGLSKTLEAAFINALIAANVPA